MFVHTITTVPAGKDFICPDAEVYYVNPKCVEIPVRKATVDAVHPDDSCAELSDDYLGDVTADFDMIFATEAEARKAAADAGLDC